MKKVIEHTNNEILVTYVPESFPQNSETFVINEIKGMIDLEFKVSVASRIEGSKNVNHENYFYIKDKIKPYKKNIFPSYRGFLLGFIRGGSNLSLKQMLKPRRLYEHILLSINIAKHVNQIVSTKPTVIIVHFGFDNAIAGAIAAKIIDCPMVLWLHGSDVYTVPHRSIEWLAKRAKSIITSSEDNQKRIASLGVKEEVVVANLGVSKEFFLDDIKKEEMPLLITVARLGHNKNLERTLRILKLVTKDFPDVKLLIAGDGPKLESLKQYTEQLGLIENVRFLGFINQKEITTLLKVAWIKLLFSDLEGKPVSIIEAQATKLPCVVSNIGGLHEIVVHGETGYLVNFFRKNQEEAENKAAEYIMGLLASEELRNIMGNAARIRAKKKFSEHLHFEFMAKTVHEALQ